MLPACISSPLIDLQLGYFNWYSRKVQIQALYWTLIAKRLAHIWWENRIYWISKCRKLVLFICVILFGISVFSSFQRAVFDGFQVIDQFADWPNIPHSSPIFMKKVIQRFPKSIVHFSDKPLSRATIYSWFKKLGDGVSDAPSKSLQRRRRLRVVDELGEIVGQSHYCTSN